MSVFVIKKMLKPKTQYCRKKTMSQKTYGFLSAILDVDLPVTDHVYIFIVCSSATFDRSFLT